MKQNSDNIFVSVSGGETSWYMAILLAKYWKDKNLLFGFANTGKERIETLMFNKKCQDYFGINVIWVEPVVHYGKRKGCTHKIVDYYQADRTGKPFQEVIQKYGIPNVAFPHCTRELKSNPLKSFADKYFGKKNYKKAIGIRMDEIDRVSKDKDKLNLIYPLISNFPTNKPTINKFWEEQPFRLELKSYEGNCDYCFKKSDRKLLTLRIEENGERFQWWHEMEHLYEFHLAGRNRSKSPPPYRFFRKNKTCNHIDNMVLHTDFKKAEDEKYKTDIVYDDYEMDTSNGCEESCEPIF